MNTVLSRFDLSDAAPDTANPGHINIPHSASMFFCLKVGSAMSYDACEARKERCYDSDNQRIRNPFHHCRGCSGYESMKGEKVVHIRQIREKKTCTICGLHSTQTAYVWEGVEGNICPKCQKAMGAAAVLGMEHEQAFEAIRAIIASFTGRNSTSWKSRLEKYLLSKSGGEMSRRGTCAGCGRHMTLPTTVEGHKVCGFCQIHIPDALIAGLTFEQAANEITKYADRIVQGERIKFDWADIKDRADIKKFTEEEEQEQESVDSDQRPDSPDYYKISLADEPELSEEIAKLTTRQQRRLRAHMLTTIEEWIVREGY